MKKNRSSLTVSLWFWSSLQITFLASITIIPIVTAMNSTDANTTTFTTFRNVCVETVHPNTTLTADLTDPVAPTPIIINSYTECRWSLALSTSRNPFQVYTTYFNERDATDSSEQLVQPNTLRYLEPVRVRGSETDSYNVFPYFILIRVGLRLTGACNDGAYSDQFYQAILQQGIRPSIRTMYSPPTSREVYPNSLQVNFRPALINLIPDEGNKIVPLNTGCLPTSATGARETGGQDRTQDRICYPAFAVPMVMLNIPIFQVRIQAIGPFRALQDTVYLTPYHSRRLEGTGRLEIARVFECLNPDPDNVTSQNITFMATSVLPKYFFPAERYGADAGDKDLAKSCPTTDPSERTQCKILNILYDSNANLGTLSSTPNATARPFHPLDSDDFFSPQFTFGTAPVFAIAGFYRPDLVILSDPDMKSIHLFEWIYNAGVNATIFDEGIGCYLNAYQLGPNRNAKPMYAQVHADQLESHYYRYRYDTLNHSDPETRSIFEIIALEDRLLVLTTSGLVVFYGNSNLTIERDRVLRAFDGEKRRYCYKFVRILKTALMQYDPIVAVTFEYTMGSDVVGETSVTDQEVHYGRFTRAASPLEWTRIGKDEYADRDVRTPESGTAVGLESTQQDLSEAIKICIEVKQNFIDTAFTDSATRNTDFKWKSENGLQAEHECIILDGSAIPTRPEVVQLLVSMTFTFYKNASCETIADSERAGSDCEHIDESVCHSYDNDTDFQANCHFGEQPIKLYVLAEHTVKKVILEGSSWRIAGILPQVPCQGRHREGVRNILPFSAAYFGLNDFRRSCYEEFFTRYRDHLYLTSMTYTRQVSNHMYLYGNKILHSSDAGQSFVQSRSFPHPDNSITTADKHETFLSREFGHQHRIRVMAFASNTQFAFLTSRRELWVGTTGHRTLIRLRPSSGYSAMSQLALYNLEGIHEGIPISILYDSYNKLFELVAVKNASTGDIVRIVKRPVSYELVVRNEDFIGKLKTITNRVVAEAMANASLLNGTAGTSGNVTQDIVVQYEVPDASLHCAFNRFETIQNYTKTLRRLQAFFIGAPTQHLRLGVSDIQPTLMAFQAATYRLIYESFLRKQDDFYSRVEKDPFELWRQNRGPAAFIGYIKYYKESPTQFGIVVDPRSSSRDKDPTDRTATVAINNYYFNYQQIVELKMTFYIKSSYLTAQTDFRVHRLDRIQMNVDNANGNLLRVDVDRVEIPRTASVKFTIIMALKKSSALVQSNSGQGLVPIPLTFHFLGAFGTCFDYPHYGTIGESLSVSVLAGCPPSTDLLFDWENTLQSLKFRHKDMKYGDQSYCHEGFFVCFYAREQVVFFFDILDMSKQKFIPFKGKYKMRIIGGGETLQSMQSYTEEQQDAYNVPGQSDVSLIWTLAPPEADEKDIEGFAIEKDPSTQENILQSGLSRIKWTCNTLSPCARVRPKINGRTIFYFRVNITNRGVDPDTLCIHERILTIMVYGFPPSPETLLLATLISCIIILLTLYLMFYCCRGHRRVWRSQKLKIWGWVQIVTDTFPKPLKNRADLDEKEQLRKDSILLSLQGHLRVPSLLHKPRRQRLASQGISLSGKSSAGSDASLESDVSSEILPQVHARKAAATWTEMVYEQIISRRLLAIVERNKRMRDAILRKVQMKASAQELEDLTERQNTPVQQERPKDPDPQASDPKAKK